ncbi:MAG: hypothetical protein ACT4PV_07145 [Planctomycetaceae bacterium]
MVLHYLDTILGFAGVMLLLSLAVTGSVQLLMALFQVRGKNLRWALEQVLDKAGRAAADVTDQAMRVSKSIALRAGGKFTKAVAVRFEELHAEVGGDVDALRAAFDTVMDRSSDRFAFFARCWTAGIGLLLAVGLQLDTPKLLRELSSNPQLAAALAAESARSLARADDAPKEPDLDAAVARIRLLRGDLEGLSLEIVPKKWTTAPYRDPLSWAGFLITALLLSFGAPFWYELLRRVAALRPLLSEKIDPKGP